MYSGQLSQQIESSPVDSVYYHPFRSQYPHREISQISASGLIKRTAYEASLDEVSNFTPDSQLSNMLSEDLITNWCALVFLFVTFYMFTEAGSRMAVMEEKLQKLEKEMRKESEGNNETGSEINNGEA
jgi:hypothetical protein